MKKIVASVGLVALGASGIQVVHAQDVTTPPQKFWNVSASLRGFYDDNINAVEKGPDKQSAFGVEVTPRVGLNWGNDQNELTLGYTYDFKYYDHHLLGQSSKYRQAHTIDFGFSHAFNERYNTALRDSFVIGQEPDLLRARNSFDTFQPVSGNNIRNYGTAVVNAQLTPELGTSLEYDNAFYHYHNSGGTEVAPSLAGLLDRIEHTVDLEANWLVLPETKVVVGYIYNEMDYTGDEPIGPGLVSKDKNERSHTGYVGIRDNLNPNLVASAQVGATYAQFYNDPNGSSSKVSPYAAASLRYNYAEQSYAELGFTYKRNATDIPGATLNGADYTKDEQSAVLYGSINHSFTPKILGSLIGQYQNSTLYGGIDDGKTENYYLLGVNLQYRFNPYLSSEIGYNFDKLDSDIPGYKFDRNRVYIGLTASY